MRPLSRAATIALLSVFVSVSNAHAECAWALIEPAYIGSQSSWWDRLWYGSGSGWVVNYFFRSAEDCGSQQSKWATEANKIMTSRTTDLNKIRNATGMLGARCVPVEALSLFKCDPA